MAVMTLQRAVFDAPFGNNTGISAEVGDKVIVLDDNFHPVWIKVRLPDRNDSPEGWVPKAAVDVNANAAGFDLDPNAFADECVRAALDYGVPAHYVMACAHMRTQITDGPHNGGNYGPFSFSPLEWPVFTGMLGPGWATDDLKDWRAQIYVFAGVVRLNVKAAAQQLNMAPTFGQLALAQIVGAKALKAISDVPDKPVTEILDLVGFDTLAADAVDVNRLTERYAFIDWTQDGTSVSKAVDTALVAALDATNEAINAAGIEALTTAQELVEMSHSGGHGGPFSGNQSTLDLGVNDVYRDAILEASDIVRLDPAALAALIDAEAGKVRTGPKKGQWDPKSFNSDSGASGLTQFLKKTWLERASDPDSKVNGAGKTKGFVTALNAVAAGQESNLLILRFDPRLSIIAAAEYARINLTGLEKSGHVSPDLGDDERARFMYLAHHEGLNGAQKFLINDNSSSMSKFAKQVGATRAQQLTNAAGGDVALAYRRWLNGYMDKKIQPQKFRRSVGPAVPTGDTGVLASFNGEVPLGLLGSRELLVEDIQIALANAGYLDPPADKIWGPVSNWGLDAFCAHNGIPLVSDFSTNVAKALLTPSNPLPDIKPRNDWFDKVIAYMNQNNYWICRYPDAVNVVYLEGVDANGTLNDDKPNVFNDLRLVFSIDQTGQTDILGSWEGTTEPGAFFTQNPLNVKGAARIQFGQFKAWAIGIHNGSHEGLRQVKPITVHRDLNKDYIRTGDKIYSGLFGINQHWGYDHSKTNIGKASAGCLVGRTKSGHKKFMSIIKKDPRYQASPTYTFMTTVLPGNAVL
ncbi:MAG: hypothetical protein GY927_23710 [bacterium]|nr:hypothetical protein [bacterium]